MLLIFLSYHHNLKTTRYIFISRLLSEPFADDHRFSHIPAHLIDFSSRFCYNGMELFDKDTRQEIEK